MTHFELFHELFKEHLITLRDLPLYSMKFSFRPTNMGVCTLLIKCTYFYFNFFFYMYSGPLNVQSQIQGRPVASCYMTSKLRNGVGVSGARDGRFMHRRNM